MMKMTNAANKTQVNDLARIIRDIAPVLQRVVPRDDSERQAVERFFSVLAVGSAKD